MADHNELLMELKLLEGELQDEEAADPLDLLELEPGQPESAEALQQQLDRALTLLQGDHEQQLQALKLFCEHRDPRALPLLQQLFT